MEVAVASPLAGTEGSRGDIFRTMDILNCQEYFLFLLNIVLLIPITFLHHCSSYPSCYVVLSLAIKRL